MSSDLGIRGLVVVAVGAAVVVGAACTLLYERLLAKRRRMLLQRDLNRLDMKVAEMRCEIDALCRASRGADTELDRDGHIFSAEMRGERDAVCMAGHGRRPVRKTNSSNLSTAGSGVNTDAQIHSAVWADDDDDDEEFFDLPDEDTMVSSETRVARLLDEVDQLLKGCMKDKQEAYKLLLKHEDEYAENVNVLWRLAKASHMLATAYGAEDNDDKKQEFVLQGFYYAQQAVRLDNSNAEAHKWFAITAGSRGEFLDLREKIEAGYMFKEHVDKALAIKPDDPTLHHLLGRFKYEVASISWIERKLAGTLFAEPPTATYPEAVEHCQKAEDLSPRPWKENRLLLAKCCISQGNYALAVSWLNNAAKVHVETPDDETAEKEVQSLLEKYGSYRSYFE